MAKDDAPPGSISEAPAIPGFAIERRIGAGAHGTVFLARETGGLGRPCALKVFAPWARERYEHEVAMCARVEEMRRRSRAPEVIQSLGCGEVASAEGRLSWIALEWAEGGSLADRVARAGPLSVEEALTHAREAARGLALLHAEGLFHRDVKPANLLLGADGRLRLADFGLARPLAGTLSAAGSPAFAAPEVIAGRVTDGRLADVYSLGATVYFLLTGETMLPGRPDVFALERRGVPRSVQSTIVRATSADPGERIGSMEALGEAPQGVTANPEISRGSPAGRDGDVAGAPGAAASEPPKRSPEAMSATASAPSAAPASLAAYTAPPERARGALASLVCALLVWPIGVVFMALFFFAASPRVVIPPPQPPTEIYVQPKARSTGPTAAPARDGSRSGPVPVDRSQEQSDGDVAGPDGASRVAPPLEESSLSWWRIVGPVVGIVVGLTPLILEVLAFVFGIVALSRIGASAGRLVGKGLAIAGIVVATLNLCAPFGFGLLVVLFRAGAAPRPG